MQAIFIENTNDDYRSRFTTVPDGELPEGDVTVAIEYSTLNYKDALAITGASPVVRAFPMVPGVDFAGTVAESSSSDHLVGDRVLVTGHGLGESHWGGLAQKARVPSDWLIEIPNALTSSQAMGIGTAGFTAMLCVLALEDAGIRPGDGEIVVTGASGGVGGAAVSLLAKAGFDVVAATGRTEQADYLTTLGAAGVIDRAELSEPGKPLGKERWAGAVDTVGSHTLANVCATTRYGGTVTACGLAQGMDFPATVAPFILRGVTLRGIESVHCPPALRKLAWDRLASDFEPAHIELMTTEVGLSETIEQASKLLAGKVRGRITVDVNR